jgi:Nucleotidyl transferase AbiEii toxin, Type IV TA system
MTEHRNHPAGDVRGLQRWISEWATATSETQARVQRRIALIAVAAMLGSGQDDQAEPLFVIKGGSALELRYGSKARASRDIDVEFRGLANDIRRTVTELINIGWSGFSGRVLDPQPLSIPWGDITGFRMDLRLTYLDQAFAKVPLEIVTRPTPEIDYVPTLRLDPVGLQGPDQIACLSLPYQIAEKLHACTDPLDGLRTNDRVSDLMDLILIEDLSPDVDPSRTRQAATDVFNERATHPWPPVASSSTEAEQLWNRLIDDTGFYVGTMSDATRRVNDLITAIDNAV